MFAGRDELSSPCVTQPRPWLLDNTHIYLNAIHFLWRIKSILDSTFDAILRSVYNTPQVARASFPLAMLNR